MKDRPKVVYATPAPPEQPETYNLAINDDENMTPSAPNPPTEATPSPACQDKKRPIPCNKSIAHWPISENRAVFVSLDIETGSIYCVIMQLSVEIFVVLYDEHDPNAEHTICQCNDTFNKYINLGENVL